MVDKEFLNKSHAIGRITLALCCVGAILVPVGMAAIYHVDIPWGMIASLSLSPFITYTISSIIGLLAQVPIMGGPALYVANVTGNVNNIKGPAAANGIEICETTPGSDEGDTASMIAVCVSSLVSALIMIAGMVFLAPLFKPVYESDFFAPAFGVVLPAMYGALLMPYFMKSLKDSIGPFLIPIAAILIFGSQFYGKYSSYIMLVMMVVSVLYIYILHKKEIDAERAANQAAPKD